MLVWVRGYGDTMISLDLDNISDPELAYLVLWALDAEDIRTRLSPSGQACHAEVSGDPRDFVRRLELMDDPARVLFDAERERRGDPEADGILFDAKWVAVDGELVRISAGPWMVW
jgi:hypothetical protein